MAHVASQPGRSSIEHFRQRWASENFNDGLERELSGSLDSGGRRIEGEERGLTELAAPRPVTDKKVRSDNLEREQNKQDKGRRSWGWKKDPSTAIPSDQELTEVAAPPPVSRGSETDEEATPADFNGKDVNEDSKTQLSETATHLYTVSWLIFFSFLGTLARLGVEAITIYPNAPWASPVLWANLGGSFALGALSEDRKVFRQEWTGLDHKSNSFHASKIEKDSDSVRARTGAAHGKVKKTIPLYIGLATGFCGSFTSFSSFLRDVFLALTNELPLASSGPYHPSRITPSRNAGFSFLALLAILFVHISISISALHVGAHAALVLSPVTPTLPFRFTRRILDPFAIFLAFGCWLGAILLSIFPPSTNYRPRATFALVFAPLGCLTRYYASKYLNARIPSFPLGTFAVNILGTCILGMCYDLQHARSIAAAPSGSYIACAVLEGVMEGFCGCLTTVSTWVAELSTLKRRHAYIYGTTSVAVALALLVVIMGSVGWTSGFGTPICT